MHLDYKDRKGWIFILPLAYVTDGNYISYYVIFSVNESLNIWIRLPRTTSCRDIRRFDCGNQIIETCGNCFSKVSANIW